MADSDSDDSFHSLTDGDHSKPTPAQPEPAQHQTIDPAAISDKFTPEEEAELLASSNELKTSGNELFGKASYSTAIQTYDRALSSCPNYLDYELAVLRSNIAACHLKLEEWKEAVESATKGVGCLDRLEPLPKAVPKNASKEEKQLKDGKEAEDTMVEEVSDDLESRIAALRASGRTLAQVRSLQVKLLLRRAKANTSLDSWSALQAADEDYRTLLSPTMQPCLSATDKRTVLESARSLTPKLNAAKDREMAEMMGKLKGLGNSILKPFGLSTENFQFEQQEGGGYTMNFNQAAGKKT
ncbi:tetratricopeptide repeat protein 1 [Zymoseptoria brevis]|uniref:Tetratricopeptide repeat protein 1 n=1 Tax=Zymoseptoria brevis TaxID=1047168 RepID=A0A0F4GX24_9PEZI|nr:tetratricopeptide repeat protein 1 [Zymoseptoria brevis]